MSEREYQLYLINYVLEKDDLIIKNKNFNIIGNYCEDYFKVIESTIKEGNSNNNKSNNINKINNLKSSNSNKEENNINKNNNQ